MKKLTVSIVIPNRDGANLLRKNLSSVLKAARGSEVIVVDDHSTDESLAVLKNEFPSVRVVIKTGTNGFASSVNTGVRVATGEIVVLLNTDVRPESNFLSFLVSHFEDPKVFAVGCLEKSIEGDKTVLRGRGVASWKRGYFIHRRGEVGETDTAWVSGGSGAFRKSIWNTLGGMNELYDPFYWEDIDLSYRARKSGYTLVFEPKSIVWHHHEEGNIRTQYTSTEITTIAYRNQYIFVWKNLSDASIWLAHIFWTKVALLRALFRGDFAMIRGYLQAAVHLPNIIRSRKTEASFWRLRDIEIFNDSE